MKRAIMILMLFVMPAQANAWWFSGHRHHHHHHWYRHHHHGARHIIVHERTIVIEKEKPHIPLDPVK